MEQYSQNQAHRGHTINGGGGHQSNGKLNIQTNKQQMAQAPSVPP